MYDKERDLFDAYVSKRLGRRDLLIGAAKLGLGASAARTLMGLASAKAMAADFDWASQKGKTIRLLLNQHPYTDAMIADVDAFKALTQIDVAYDVFPEDVYFDNVAAALSSGSDRYDAIMTGAYQTWTYGPAGWIEDLNPYLRGGRTSPHYDWGDVLPSLRASTAWNGVAGAPLGSADAKQWCIPWGYELNSISYNRTMFDRLKLDPPANMAKLMEAAAKVRTDAGGPYGIGVRGSRSWATIHAGLLSAYTNFGQRDFTVADGKLKAAMNTPGSKTFHADWVKMIQESGPGDWPTCDWYQVGTDLGVGASGMIYDADIVGYFANGGDNKMAGRLAYHAIAPNPAATAPTPNVWIWSLAMPTSSRQKDAAWLWMQWATSAEHDLFGARTMDAVNPVRTSVAADPDWRARISKAYPGYIEQLDASSPGARIYFTPQPLFTEVTTRWAEALQRMVAREVPVDEGLDALAAEIDGRLRDAGLG